MSDATVASDTQRGQGAAALGTAQGDADVGARARAPPATSPARLPDGNVVLTPSALDYLEMDARRPRGLRPRRRGGGRPPQPDDARRRSTSSALKRYPEIDATMHCHAKHVHDVRPHPPADPGASSRSSSCTSAATSECADYKTTGTARARRGGRAAGSPTAAAVLMANHGLFAVRQEPEGRMHIAGLVERTAEIVWGAQRAGRDRAAARGHQPAVRRLLPLRPHREVLTPTRASRS